MAAHILRTVANDLTDATDAAASTQRELANVQAHLARAVADPTPGNTAGLRRAAAILAGVAAELAAHASEAHRRASMGQLTLGTSSK